MRVDKEILFCFGSFLSPSFEQVTYDPATPNLTLERAASGDAVAKRAPAKEGAEVGVVKPTVVGDQVNVIGPGSVAASKRKDGTSSSRKRKLSERKAESLAEAAAAASTSVSFGEILAASAEPRKASSAADASSSSQLGLLPKPKEKTILLTQGLVSGNVTIVNDVLLESNDSVIRNTVKALSIDYVPELLDTLSPRLSSHAKSATNAAKWLRWVLKLHAGFLLSHGHLLGKMERIRRAMDARTETLERATRLHGRIELILTQVKLRKERKERGNDGENDEVMTTTRVAGVHPLYTYEEDSGDENDDDDELMKSMKDSESEDEDAAMGEWINISAPGSPEAATAVEGEEEEQGEGRGMEG